MSTVEIINLICLLLISAPFALIVTQAIKRCGWAERWRFLLAAFVGVLVGVAQTSINGTLGALFDHWGTVTALEVVVQVGLVWATAQAWYHLYFADVPWMLKLGEWPDKPGEAG